MQAAGRPVDRCHRSPWHVFADLALAGRARRDGSRPRAARGWRFLIVAMRVSGLGFRVSEKKTLSLHPTPETRHPKPDPGSAAGPMTFVASTVTRPSPSVS